MFLHPEKSIGSLLLKEGMKVADFGAGSGHLTRVISRRVGHTGYVYAIDVQKEIVKKLEADLEEEGIKNVKCIWGDVGVDGGTKLAGQTVDVVVMSNIFFQTDDKLGVIDESKRILKKGGRVLCIDWNDKGFPQKRAEELFEKRGFKFVENLVSSSHHYGIIFKYE
ncbi:MAG: methyltransferase domain-containing protein [bacterium]